MLFITLVVAKINFSSISMLNNYVQPGEGSEFITPVFGTPRSIRSDEWAVSTPRALTYQYCAGEYYNDIIMATETPNLSATNILSSLAILAKPLYIGYLFLGVEYAVSFYWCGLLILSLLITTEAFLIITKKRSLLSVMGSSMVVLSQFFLWWSGMKMITFGLGAVTFIYHFFNTTNTKYRIGFGLLVAVFGASFVCELYPAWLVPLAYVFLAIIIWIFIYNFKNIRAFKTADWIIFSVALIFAILIIATFYFSQIEYLNAVTSTVYPGKRVDNGGYSLEKLFNYVPALKFPFDDTGFVASEQTVFFSLYPLPSLLAVFLVFKAKKKDILNIFLIIVSIFLTLYCTIGLPAIVAKITMMSSSTATRAADVLAFIQILLLLRSMAVIEEENIKIPIYICVPVSVAISFLTVYVSKKNFPLKDYMNTIYIIVFFAFIIYLIISFLSSNKEIKTAAIIVLISVHLVTGAMVWPVQKGLDPIYSKPVSVKISEIVEKNSDAKWIAVDQWVEANFYAACGARVINSNNYIPNIDMWETLFPDKQYEEIYNRYSNMIISITDEKTHLQLNQADLITLHLSYDDFEKINVEYIIVKRKIEPPTTSNIMLNEIYAESSIYIYKVNYLR